MIRIWVGACALLLLLSARVEARIVGIAIAKSNDHVYAYFDDGTFSSGNSGNFALYTHPAPYTPAGNDQSGILAVSINRQDHVFVWYRDGRVSDGNSSNLGLHGVTTFKPASGKTIDQIRAIGIAGSDDKVYTWYADGTVSVGKSSDLGFHQGAKPLAVPVDMNNVAEIDIAGDDRVYTWYLDGTFTIGTTGNLAKLAGPSGYRDVAVLATTFGGRRGPKDPRKRPPRPPPSFGDGVKVKGIVPNFGGGVVDPMVAVSSHFMIVSDQTGMYFADRDGTPLDSGVGGSPTVFPAPNVGGFFARFLDERFPGGPNPTYINHHVGFPGRCDGFPPTVKGGFCINGTNDLRVFFDPGPDGGHFFVETHARNALFAKDLDVASDQACATFVSTRSTFQTRSCKPRTDGNFDCPIVDKKQCALTRRVFFLAVSKTEDPRDGWFQYAVTENDYADFPWLAINRNRVVVAAHGPNLQPPHWPTPQPVAFVFDKRSLFAGSKQPAFFTYGPDDLNGLQAVDPVTQPGGGAAATLMLGMDGSKVSIFGFLDGPDPWKKAPVIHAAFEVGANAPGLSGAVHRNAMLHLVGIKHVESNAGATRNSIRVMRVPVSHSGNDILVSKDPSAGFIDQFFGLDSPDDPPESKISYELPSIAVNKAGDMLIGYHRVPFANSSLKPDARVSLWPAGATAPLASQLVKTGETSAPGPSVELDYSTTVVDPDDTSFWVAQPFARNTPGALTPMWQIVIGHIVP